MSRSKKKYKMRTEIYRDKWEWQYDTSKLLGCSESSNKKNVYIIAGHTQETRETSKVKNLTSHLTKTRKNNNYSNPESAEGRK